MSSPAYFFYLLQVSYFFLPWFFSRMNADLNSHSSSSRGSCSPRLLTKSVDCLSYLLLLSNSHLPLLFESSSPPMFTTMAPFQVVPATNQSKTTTTCPLRPHRFCSCIIWRSYCYGSATPSGILLLALCCPPAATKYLFCWI